VSALELRRIKRASPFSCQVEGCRRLGHATDRMLSVAKVEAFICGRPAGLLCKRHADEWRAAWDEALREEALPAISAYQRLGKAIRVETNETPAELDRRLNLDGDEDAAA
jgi:hypothetical protein